MPRYIIEGITSDKKVKSFIFEYDDEKSAQTSVEDYFLELKIIDVEIKFISVKNKEE